jgi:pimeloyl-ACP methyl ester carboxylesterase
VPRSTQPRHPTVEELNGGHRDSARITTRVTSPDGTELSVYEHGPSDAPAVLLVHGWTLNASFFSDVVADLSRDFRTITYDQRGHGFSSKPGSQGYTQTAIAQDLRAVLEARLAEGERVVYCGHSMGGMAVMALAQYSPEVVSDRFRAALLVSTASDQLPTRSTVIPMPGVLRRIVMPLISPISKRVMSRPPGIGGDGLAARLMIRLSTTSYLASRTSVIRSTRTVLSCPPGVQNKFTDLLWNLDVNTGVTQLDVPTHVLVGRGDKLTPPWHSHRIAERLPRSTGLTVVPRVGHMPPVESPGEIIHALRRLAAD